MLYHLITMASRAGGTGPAGDPATLTALALCGGMTLLQGRWRATRRARPGHTAAPGAE